MAKMGHSLGLVASRSEREIEYDRDWFTKIVGLTGHSLAWPNIGDGQALLFPVAVSGGWDRVINRGVRVRTAQPWCCYNRPTSKKLIGTTCYLNGGGKGDFRRRDVDGQSAGPPQRS